MAARLGDEDEDIIAAINVTPLVDVVLVLLIIFMVTASYIIAPLIRVELPRVSSEDAADLSPLTIGLDRQARLYLQGSPITELELTVLVRDAVARSPSVQAILSADRAVSHGEVMRIIDLVKRSGVTRFAVSVNPAPPVVLEPDPAAQGED